MMGELPEGPRGRLLAVLLLLAVLGAIWAGIAVPLTNWYGERNDTIDRQTILARRMTQIAATLPDLRAQAAAIQTAAPVTVLDGASDSVAGAALQQRLQQIGTSLDTPLASTEVLAGEAAGAYRRIGVRLAVTAHWPVIVRLMAAVDANTPRLLVNDMQIQSQRANLADSNPLLTVNMVVFGFRAGGPTPPTATLAPGTQP